MIGQVHIRADSGELPWAGLIPVLQDLFPLKFRVSEDEGAERTAEIIVGSDPEADCVMGNRNVPSLRIPSLRDSGNDGELVEAEVRFAEDAEVPYPFRGRTLTTNVPRTGVDLRLAPGERVLAIGKSGPIWSVSLSAGVKHFQSSFSFPFLSLDRCLRDVFHGDRFLEMLPLLQWLRHICAPGAFQGPPLRACFMLDDPNLHWPRYGHVHFEHLATSAERENYHVSFATIPFDGWFTHRPTAALFRRIPERLSLLVHGNDHVYKELARSYTQVQRQMLLQQALRRIRRIEGAAGIEVSRVMVPPHGACSDTMLEELPGSGFEAACISHGSLRAYNKSSQWTRTLGYRPGELIHGCPVLPRWGLSGNAQNTILLAAFLQQPIILMGHHQDLRNGIDLLEELAQFINGLGSVLWSNMSELARTSYQWRLDGDLLRIRPLASKLVVQCPRAARRILVEGRPARAAQSFRIVHFSGAGVEAQFGNPVSLPDALLGSLTIDMLPVLGPSQDWAPRGSPVWAIVRRLLAEGRDRSQFWA